MFLAAPAPLSGWEFGEVANGQRGQVAVQQQLAGSKIGAFNDRCSTGLGTGLATDGVTGLGHGGHGGTGLVFRGYCTSEK